MAAHFGICRPRTCVAICEGEAQNANICAFTYFSKAAFTSAALTQAASFNEKST